MSVRRQGTAAPERLGLSLPRAPSPKPWQTPGGHTMGNYGKSWEYDRRNGMSWDELVISYNTW